MQGVHVREYDVTTTFRHGCSWLLSSRFFQILTAPGQSLCSILRSLRFPLQLTLWSGFAFLAVSLQNRSRNIAVSPKGGTACEAKDKVEVAPCGFSTHAGKLDACASKWGNVPHPRNPALRRRMPRWCLGRVAGVDSLQRQLQRCVPDAKKAGGHTLSPLLAPSDPSFNQEHCRPSQLLWQRYGRKLDVRRCLRFTARSERCESCGN